jgi:hypothetical protein
MEDEEVVLKLVRKTDQAVVTANAVVADVFFTRLKGLIGKTTLHPGEGMLFPKCSSIHMWMMSIPIDVLFLKRSGDDWQILSSYAGLKPWKLLPVGNWRADDALELPSGTISKLNLSSGEVLCIAS